MLPAVAMGFAVLPLLAAQPQSPTVKLESLQNRQRVLLVFSNGDNHLAELQLTIAAQNAAGFRERDLVLAGLSGTDASVPAAMLSAGEDAAARKRFGVRPGQFTVILIGKDGGEKLRSHTPLSWTVLQSTIDAMPMRKDEMREVR